MSFRPKKWIAYLSVGCGLIYAVLSLASARLSADKARELIDIALRTSDARILRSLPLTSTLAVAALSGSNANDTNVNRIIQDFDRAIKLPASDFDGFAARIEDLSRRNDSSRYGTVPRLSVLKTYRDFWNTGNVERFNWTSDRNPFGAIIIEGVAIPAATIRAHCLSYTEGAKQCVFLAATVTLKDVTGIIGDNDSKRVDFSVHVAPTEQEISFRTAWPSMTAHSGSAWNAFDTALTAQFVCYDDGWRLQNWTLPGVNASIPF